MNKNNFISKRMLIGLLVFAFIAILSVGSAIAWYSAANENEINDLKMTSSDLPFEIATKGSTVRHQSILRPNSDNDYYDLGTEETVLGSGGSNGTYNVLREKECLMLRFTPTVPDDPTTTDIDESQPDIDPGSSGQLNLYVIPKESGTLTARVSMNIVAYAKVGTDIKRVSDIQVGNGGLTQLDIDRLKQAEDYLNGHIMFFGAESGSDQYYYTNPYTDKTFKFVQENAVAGTAYSVPIYWMWVYTFGQIALKDNTENLRGTLIPVVQDSNAVGSDKLKVIQYLKDHKNIIFQNLDKIANLSEEAKQGRTEEQIAQMINTAVDNRIDNANQKANFTALSSGYNLADFIIGTNLAYFVIEVQVEASE